MDTLIKICAVALIGALAALLLKKEQPHIAMAVALGAGVIILLSVIGQLGELIDSIRRMTSSASLPEGIMSAVFKAAGICVFARLCAELCRDSGESALAAKVELAAAVITLVVCMPMMTSLISVIGGLMR